MNPSWQNIHKAFRLNGIAYSLSELYEVGYSLVKEGQEFEKAIGDFLLDWCSHKTTLEVFTSGSTGEPKRIQLQKTHMVNSALATGTYFNLQEGNTALLCLPVGSIAGKMMLVRAMVLGLRLDYVAPSSQPLLKIEQQYDFCAMVPLQAQKSLHQLERVKTLILGGAAVSFLLEKELKGIPISVYETYGMTETITHVAVRQIAPRTDTYFRLLPHIEIAQDNRGCLVLEAPKVSDTPVVTNDLVKIENTDSFTWLGRFDNVINSGGIKLFPEQIEKKLSQILDFRFFVAGIPDKVLGQKLVLVAEQGEENTETILEKIHHSKLLDKYEIPKQVYGVRVFKETRTGKINKRDILQEIT